jgi:UDP-N-acetylglucosamine acyltransferase
MTHISKRALIDEGVKIGRYTIIEDDVRIGAHTRIGDHVIIRNGSVIGKDNHIYSGVHIGVEPQDYHFEGEPSQCIIGNNNTIRECATLSRATGKDHHTRVGDSNHIMTYVHVAHNDRIGSYTVIASGAQLGGYVVIGDHVNIGGLSGVHQFCMVGAYAMLGAKSYLNQDLLPCLLAQGNRAAIYKVNTVGLQRNGFDDDEIEAIKQLFRSLLVSHMGLDQWRTTIAHASVRDGVKAVITDFIQRSKRGILLRTANR